MIATAVAGAVARLEPLDLRDEALEAHRRPQPVQRRDRRRTARRRRSRCRSAPRPSGRRQCPAPRRCWRRGAGTAGTGRATRRRTARSCSAVNARVRLGRRRGGSSGRPAQRPVALGQIGCQARRVGLASIPHRPIPQSSLTCTASHRGAPARSRSYASTDADRNLDVVHLRLLARHQRPHHQHRHTAGSARAGRPPPRSVATHRRRRRPRAAAEPTSAAPWP